MPEVNEEKIKKDAEQYARKHKKEIAKRITDKSKYIPDEAPVSIFMAGSPGAGKTEFSKRILDQFNNDGKGVLRIDPDELRHEFTDYNGKNSYLFQFAISILVGKILDEVIKNNQNFILDGTFSKFRQARENVQRSIKYNRKIEIFYIYQDPVLAWEFTKRREEEEGRFMPREAFIEQFFGAQESVNKLKEEFKERVELHLVIKNLKNKNTKYKDNIQNVDYYIRKYYTEEELERILS